MRRKEREIQERARIDEILHQALVCRLGLCKDNQPYIVPVSFGYDGKALYLHTAPEGMKIDFWLANPLVCFEVEEGVEMRLDETSACKGSAAYRSVIGWGTIHELIDAADKEHGLNQIMQHYTGRNWQFSPQPVERTRVWRIDIESIGGKQA